MGQEMGEAVAHATGCGRHGGWVVGAVGSHLPPSLHVFAIVHGKTFKKIFF